jgi:tetratricopeptide (TPR) repeat protein
VLPDNRLQPLSILLAAFFSLPLSAQSPPTSSSCHPGVYQLARGDYASALKSLTAATSQEGSDASLLNNRGVAELLAGDVQRAQKSFSEAAQKNPTLLDPRFNLGIIALRLGDFDAARTHFDSVWKAGDSPLRARAAYHHALADDRLGKLDEAENWLGRALEAEPTLSDAKLYLGVVHERKKEFAEAGKYYKEFLVDHPDNAVAMLRFGVSAIRAGYPDTARRYLHQVVQQAPDSIEAQEARKYLFTLE